MHCVKNEAVHTGGFTSYELSMEQVEESPYMTACSILAQVIQSLKALEKMMPLQHTAFNCLAKPSI